MHRILTLLVAFSLLHACGDDDVDTGPDAALDGGQSDAADDANTSEVDASSADAESDVGEGDVRESDAGPQRVPLFLAIGWGGRHLISCDGGRSWIADRSESTEDDWHQSYTPKSLAYHDGLFVRMTGWGTDSTIHSSRDGLEWTSVVLEGGRAGAIGFDGRWVALSGRTIYESDDALEWRELEGVEGARLNRDGAVYEGMWIAGTDEVVRHRRDEDWVDLESCTGPRHGSIGVNGGFAASPERVVSFGHEGTTCVVDRRTGEDLGAGSMDQDRIQGVGAYIAGEFWLASTDVLHRSSDGIEWESGPLPEGVRMNLLAEGNGTIVGANRNGDAFYYSDDGGASWEIAEGPEGNNLYRMVFGWAEPSEMCPAP